MNTLRKQLAQHIREARQRAGLTQRELALMVGLRSETISNIEGGRRNTTLDTITAIAKALDVEMRLQQEEEWRVISLGRELESARTKINHLEAQVHYLSQILIEQGKRDKLLAMSRSLGGEAS